VAPSVAEKLFERSRSRGDRLRVGALLGLVLRVGEAVTGAANVITYYAVMVLENVRLQ
jgi:hypothetical protein